MSIDYKHTLTLKLITSINEKINSHMGLAELLNTIMDMAKELVNAEGSSLLLSDLKTGDLIFNIVIGDKGTIIKGERIPKGKGIAGTVAEGGKPVIVNNVQHDPRFFSEIDKKSNFKTKNILSVPMRVMGKMIGVLELVNSIDRDEFDRYDLRLAHYIADQAAIAIDNRRLYDDLNRRIDELTALYEISQAISYTNLVDQDMFYTILQTISKMIGVKKSSIFIFDKHIQKLKLMAGYGLPAEIKPGHQLDLESSIAGFVFKIGDPMLVADVKSEMPEGLRNGIGSYETSSFISVPIVYKNKTLGILSMADKIDGENFDSFDLRVLSTICNQIGETYKNLINQEKAITQKRLKQEIDIAAEIQKKILPEIPANFNEHTLAAYNEPAKVVGGDFYDIFKFDEKKYGILVADVSGKGIPAAMFMGLARNIIRAENRVNTSPSNLLRSANNLICKDSEHGMFVTLFYAIIDSHNQIITYSSGGHNNQLLVKKETRESIRLNARGKALGMREDLDYEEKVVMYSPGDMLLLFTDGILEALGGEDLNITTGEEMLAAMALAHLDSTPAEFISVVKENYVSHTVDLEYKDDFTIFVVKF